MQLSKRARLSLGLALVLASLGVVFAQDRPAIPPPDTIGLDQPVPVDPRITIGYLPERAALLHPGERPSRTSGPSCAWSSTSARSLEDDDQRGLAHFVEHMAFNGSEHFAKQDLIKFMESIGMRLGPGVNANTAFDETIYMLHVPTDNPRRCRRRSCSSPTSPTA